MSVPKDLLEILVCPKCKGELEHKTDDEGERLVCQACRLPPIPASAWRVHGKPPANP